MRGEVCDPKGRGSSSIAGYIAASSYLQRTRSLTSEYGKRNVGGEVLAVCSERGGRLTRPLAVLRFGRYSSPVSQGVGECVGHFRTLKIPKVDSSDHLWGLAISGGKLRSNLSI
jgi:hypothetical protein